MSEEDVRGGLRDAVVEEPPLNFDPDALVATARQQVRRRRALMAAGAATVAVAVAAVALPVALGRAPAHTMAADQPTSTAPATTAPTTSAPARIEWPPPGVQPVHRTAEQLRTRGQEMSTYLRQTVPAVLPDVSDVEVGEFGGEAVGDFSDDQPSVNAAVDYTAGGLRYSIDVQVWAPGGANDLLDVVCPESTSGCQQIGEQDGGPLVVTTESVLGDGKISSVYHLRKDGSAVRIAAYNYQLSGEGKQFGTTIPVTVDQQLRLATDPELGL